VPKAIFMWGGNLPTGSGFILSHADLVAWGIGASDMTTGVYAGVSDDDGLGTSDTNRSWTDQVVWQARGPSNALLQECTASVVGEVVRLDWTTVDGTAREFNYVIFGEVPLAARSGECYHGGRCGCRVDTEFHDARERRGRLLDSGGDRVRQRGDLERVVRWAVVDGRRERQ
jgi:hypothetical protein